MVDQRVSPRGGLGPSLVTPQGQQRRLAARHPARDERSLRQDTARPFHKAGIERVFERGGQPVHAEIVGVKTQGRQTVERAVAVDKRRR